jgi:hypothetical protein
VPADFEQDSTSHYDARLAKGTRKRKRKHGESARPRWQGRHGATIGQWEDTTIVTANLTVEFYRREMAELAFRRGYGDVGEWETTALGYERCRLWKVPPEVEVVAFHTSLGGESRARYDAATEGDLDGEFIHYVARLESCRQGGGYITKHGTSSYLSKRERLRLWKAYAEGRKMTSAVAVILERLDRLQGDVADIKQSNFRIEFRQLDEQEDRAWLLDDDLDDSAKSSQS